MKHLLITLLFTLLFGNLSIAQFEWNSTNGPAGGYFTKIESGSDYIFTANRYNIQRTNGQLWETVEMPAIQHLSVSGTNLIGLQNYHYDVVDSPVIQYSYDNGDTWNERDFPKEINGKITEIVLNNSGIFLFAHPSDKLLWSKDGGNTFEVLSTPGIDRINNIWSQDDKIFVRKGSKLYELDYTNKEWTALFDGLTSSDMDLIVKDSFLIISTPQYFRSSTNYGKNWWLSQGGKTGNQTVIAGDRIYNTLAANRVRYSDDRGKTWKVKYLDEGYYPSFIGSINNEVYLSFYRKNFIYKYDIIKNEIMEATGGMNLRNSYFMKVFNNYLYAVGGRVNRYNLITEEWEKLPLETEYGSFTNIAVSKSGKIAIYEYYKINLSTDDGQTWQEADYLNYFIEIENILWWDEKMVVETRNGLFIYDESGQLLLMYEPYNSAIIMHANNTLYALNADGKIAYLNKSTLKWKEVETPFEKFNFIRKSGNKIVAGVKKGDDILLVSTPGFVYWDYCGEGLENVHNMWELKFFGDYTFRYALDGSYLYQSSDHGTTWQLIAQPGHVIEIHDNKIYEGSNGVFWSHLPTEKKFAAGTVYNDVNNNGVLDEGEEKLSNIKIEVKSPLTLIPYYSAMSGKTGHYNLLNYNGNYDTIYPVLNNEYVQNINPPNYSLSESGNNYNFGIHFKDNINDLEIQGSFNTSTEPGHEVILIVSYSNKGTTLGKGKIGVKLDPGFEYDASYPAPSQIIGADSLVWEFDELGILAVERIRIEGKISSMLSPGDVMITRGSVISDDTETELSNNYFITENKVGNSVKSNIKTVSPEAGLTKEEVLEGKELIYTIYFQNLGDYAAHTVKITDILDERLVANSVRIVDASHTITEMQLKPGRLLSVELNSINLLPASAHELKSKGFVTFAVRVDKRWASSFTVRNKAVIRMNYEVPMFTNRVISVTQSSTVSANEQFQPDLTKPSLIISPNPIQQFCMLRTEGKLSGKGTLTILNTKGQICRVQAVDDLQEEIQVNTDMLPDGVYIFSVRGKEGVMSGKGMVARK